MTTHDNSHSFYTSFPGSHPLLFTLAHQLCDSFCAVSSRPRAYFKIHSIYTNALLAYSNPNQKKNQHTETRTQCRSRCYRDAQIVLLLTIVSVCVCVFVCVIRERRILSATQKEDVRGSGGWKEFLFSYRMRSASSQKYKLYELVLLAIRKMICGVKTISGQKQRRLKCRFFCWISF